MTYGAWAMAAVKAKLDSALNSDSYTIGNLMSYPENGDSQNQMRQMSAARSGALPVATQLHHLHVLVKDGAPGG